MKNRYAVFVGSRYYPSGGFNDLIGSFETIDLARFQIEKNEDIYDWVHIVDLEQCKILLDGDCSGGFMPERKWTWVPVSNE